MLERILDLITGIPRSKEERYSARGKWTELGINTDPKDTFPSDTLVFEFPNNGNGEKDLELDSQELRKYLAWTTGERPGSDARYVVGSDGRLSDLGIKWEENIVSIWQDTSEGQKELEIQYVFDIRVKDRSDISGKLITLKKRSYLCLKLSFVDWDFGIAPLVTSHGLVSGRDKVGGFPREVLTRGKTLPFQELYDPHSLKSGVRR